MAASATSPKIEREREREKNNLALGRRLLLQLYFFSLRGNRSISSVGASRGGSSSLPGLGSGGSSIRSILPDWATHGRTGCKIIILHCCLSSFQDQPKISSKYKSRTSHNVGGRRQKCEGGGLMRPDKAGVIQISFKQFYFPDAELSVDKPPP